MTTKKKTDRLGQLVEDTERQAARIAQLEAGLVEVLMNTEEDFTAKTCREYLKGRREK